MSVYRSIGPLVRTNKQSRHLGGAFSGDSLDQKSKSRAIPWGLGVGGGVVSSD